MDRAPDPSPLGTILVGVGVFASAAIVVALTIGASQYAGFLFDAEHHDKVLDRPSPYLPAVRAHETEALAGYRWIDRKAGVVGLPLERALELTLAERRQP